MKKVFAIITLSAFLLSNISSAFALRGRALDERPGAQPGMPYMSPDTNHRGPVAIVGKLGGTSMAFQAAIQNGFLGKRIKRDTPNKDTNTQQEVVDSIVESISGAIDQYGADRVAYVHFTTPGFFNPDGTQAEDEPNIPAIKKGFSFQREISKRLAEKYPRPAALGPIRVIVVHDGTGGANGERSVFGSYPEADDLFFVIAGTGVGTRRILNRKPFTGGKRVNYLHNEGPHCLVFNGDEAYPDFTYVALKTKGKHPDFKSRTLPDGQPNPFYGKQDLEDRTKGGSIAAYAQQLAESGRFDEHYITDLARRTPGGTLAETTTKELGEAAKQSNPLALQAIEERGRELGIGLAVLIVESMRSFKGFTFPRYIVIGSGVAQIGPIFINAVRDGFRQRLERYVREDQKLVFDPRSIDGMIRCIQPSAIEDDTARELLAGLPTKAQLEEHAAKLQVVSARRNDQIPAGMVDIDDYYVALKNENSDACWELKEGYQDEWTRWQGRLITMIEKYRELYPKVKYVAIARAGGRITGNEHTDYAFALSFGMAAMKDLIAIVGENPDGENLVLNNMEPNRFPPFSIQVNKISKSVKLGKKPWYNFALAVYSNLIPVFESYGKSMPAMCTLLDGREDAGGVPLMSNMSSSAAMQMSEGVAATTLGGLATQKAIRTQVALAGMRAENLVGFDCGTLDEVSSLGRLDAVDPSERDPAKTSAVIIDCVPRLEPDGTTPKINTIPVEFPADLEAVCVNTGPKDGEVEEWEYNVRVIEGELGSWILARMLRDSAKFAGQMPEKLRGLDGNAAFQARVREVYGDVDRTASGKPYLYDENRPYPVFLKPHFFSSSAFRELGLDVTQEQIDRWVRDNLSLKMSLQELIEFCQRKFGPQATQEFIDFFVKSASPFHYNLVRKILEDRGIAEKDINRNTLEKWIQAYLRGDLKSVKEEMGDKGVSDLFDANVMRAPVVFNLQGTFLHNIGDDDRALMIRDALRNVSKTTGAEREAALIEFGRLERQSYESLRHNYRNSTENIDTIAEWATQHDWCLGARHFGAGWGGWMEVWVKPGRYQEAQRAIREFLKGESWYRDAMLKLAAGEKAKNPTAFADFEGDDAIVEYYLQHGVERYRPGAPAGVLGAVRPEKIILNRLRKRLTDVVDLSNPKNPRVVDIPEYQHILPELRREAAEHPDERTRRIIGGLVSKISASYAPATAMPLNESVAEGLTLMQEGQTALFESI